MSSHDYKSAERPAPDQVLTDIADYALSYRIDSKAAYETAYYCLMDTLACGFQALQYPACTKLMGPVVQGAVLPGGARVPGTSYELDPVQAARQNERANLVLLTACGLPGSTAKPHAAVS